MLLRSLFKFLTITFVIALAGCASFPQQEVAQAGAMPDVSQYQHKPSVYVDFRFFRGKPGDNSTPVELPQAKAQLHPMIERVLSDSHLFSSYTFDEFQKDKTDYTIKIYAYNHGNAGLAAIGGFITGFTFGVIPTAVTDQYTVTVAAVDKNGAAVKDLTNHDEVTTWLGLWLIPAMGKTPAKAVNITLENQVKSALKELVESGSLKYSWLTHRLNAG